MAFLVKATIIIGAALLIVSAALPARSTEQNDSAVTVVTDTTLSVDELAKNPKAFAGREIKVMGVVGAVVSKQKIFTIIDQSEYAECKVVTCARYEVPVEFPGKLPDSEQLVIITGKLVQPQPGRFLFKAERMEIIK
jgi:hypothetical protein